MNILEVRNLCKSYNVNGCQNNILENVNFNISKGEMVAIMGLPVQVNRHYFTRFQVWIV